MRYRCGWIPVMAVVVSMVLGCAQTPEEGERAPFEVVQKKANQITAVGGVADVGIGSSRTVHLALDKAKTRGRKALAKMTKDRIEALKKAVLRELDVVDEAPLNSLFSAASASVEHRILRSSTPKDLKTLTQDNLTTAWALMVVDPSVIVDALEEHADAARNLYTRIQTTDAFAALKKTISDYENFKANSDIFTPMP